ncbi:hypothetical protein [Streptacidiphilus cavernicola]|uniref:Uncharacterized protein n=1 Tax=Streptacidiphilus cavernicola TaxID=3342716 RepID=A0ABV6V0X8_9ACTN
MSTSSDDLEAEIDAWVEEHIARSPAWSSERWASILAILGNGEEA